MSLRQRPHAGSSNLIAVQTDVVRQDGTLTELPVGKALQVNAGGVVVWHVRREQSLGSGGRWRDLPLPLPAARLGGSRTVNHPVRRTSSNTSAAFSTPFSVRVDTRRRASMVELARSAATSDDASTRVPSSLLASRRRAATLMASPNALPMPRSASACTVTEPTVTPIRVGSVSPPDCAELNSAAAPAMASAAWQACARSSRSASEPGSSPPATGR